MKFLWLIYIQPEYLDFYGSLVGASIGIVGVYLSVQLTANRERKRDKKLSLEAKKKEEQDKDKKKIEEYQRAIQMAEVSLQECLTQAHVNLRNLHLAVELIKDRKATLNLPRDVVFDQTTMYKFRNLELINKWLRLSLQIKRINDLTEDFRVYYQQTIESVRIAQLGTPVGEQVSRHMNVQMMLNNYQTLADYGTDSIAATERLVEQLLEVLALVTLHAKLPNDYFKTFASMNEYRILLEDHEKELEELRERFNPAELFTSMNTSDPLPQA